MALKALGLVCASMAAFIGSQAEATTYFKYQIDTIGSTTYYEGGSPAGGWRYHTLYDFNFSSDDFTNGSVTFDPSVDLFANSTGISIIRLLPGNGTLTINATPDAIIDGVPVFSSGTGSYFFTMAVRDSREVDEAKATIIGTQVSTTPFTATKSITSAPSTVPEPATWAMMVGGFGLIGGAMRRKRVAVRYA